MIQKKRKSQETSMQWALKPQTVGILSLSPGSGGMHLAIMLANYATSRKRLKTAVVLENKKAIECLRKLSGMEEGPVVIQRITFYSFEEKRISDIMNSGFQMVIFQMNSRKEGYWEEFLRCDKPIVIGKFSEWNEEGLTSFVEQSRELSGFGKWKFLHVFGPTDYVMKLCRDLHITMEKVPWNQDAFSVSRENFSFLESLI